MRCGRGQLKHSAALNVSDLALLAIGRNQRGGTLLDARLPAGENTRLPFGWSRGRLPTRTPVAVSCGPRGRERPHFGFPTRLRDSNRVRRGKSRRCVCRNQAPVIQTLGRVAHRSRLGCPGYPGRARASIPRASPAHRHRPPLSAVGRHHRDFDAGCGVATGSTVVARGARGGEDLRGARPGCASSRRLRRSAHAGVRYRAPRKRGADPREKRATTARSPAVDAFTPPNRSDDWREPRHPRGAQLRRSRGPHRRQRAHHRRDGRGKGARRRNDSRAQSAEWQAVCRYQLCGHSRTLLESELFGFERGAFTGADRRREGTLKSADGGSVFFDEIGDMGLVTQAKILRGNRGSGGATVGRRLARAN